MQTISWRVLFEENGSAVVKSGLNSRGDIVEVAYPLEPAIGGIDYFTVEPHLIILNVEKPEDD